MASEDEVKALRPPSLLEVLDNREKTDGPRLSLTHLLYVAKTQDKDAALEFHREVMVDLQKVEGGVTGILLVQDGALVHYMEASNFHTNAFLRHLNTQGKGVVSDARVMLSSEDCDRRNFSKWTSLHVNAASEGDVSISGEDPTDLAFDLFTNLCKIQSAGEKPVTMCPSAQRVEAYTTCEGFFLLEEYLDMFDAPVTLVLGSEKVWPLQPTVSYAGL
eukprot:CAMPEP_0182591858 /NCGR_PEP_ID=MMETSP1324-20130603/74717_1 /TAXON_ID=236786 /ORGANISM="Florenciella sp., Strain RCC1587" /LENGTH=217 /DNA_ID=CAMNT_0024809203 /DNA_START=13 /DNA_END=666 /DNA_ORIENTATION=-